MARNGDASASAAKVAAADRGPKSDLAAKIELVATYIQNNASKHGGVKKMKCPAARDWLSISSQSAATLPTPAALGIFANEAMHKAARTHGGSYEKAYFEAARARLLSKSA
jgi:hypothetical protein